LGDTQAYLAQDVLILGTLTVYETLYYSAKLRFKDITSESETKRLVMCAIEEVGLVDAANTRVGTWFQRGISGGERRRVSIAIELLAEPSLIFLDEPTSGLDR
jgi:ABC-type multidrug transport system ATPase subunit